MANKLISELTAKADPIGEDLMEVQDAYENVTKRSTITQVTSVEAAARAAQDNVIEAGAGLNANGTFVANDLTANTWFLRAADFTTGTTDRAGATGSIVPQSIVGALRLLDGRLYATWSLVSGISSDFVVTQVKLSSLQSRNLNNGGAGYTIIPAIDPPPTDDYFFNIIDAVAWNDFNTAAMNYGADTMNLFYATASGTTIGSWTAGFLNSAADLIQKWTHVDNYAMVKNQAVKVWAPTQNDATGTYTGNIYLRLVYQVIYLDAGTLPDD